MASAAQQTQAIDAGHDTQKAPRGRLRVAAGSVGAAILGAAPHVLHHAGLVAGAAIFAGIGGTLLFGALGLVAAIPFLLKLRRRTDSWRMPAAALALFATLFVLSSFVIGPALTGGAMNDNGKSSPASEQKAPESEHQLHHPG